MSKTLHIDLEDGQWVEVRDPRHLSMRTITKWQRATEDGSLDNESFIRELVAAWHLIDPDTGQPMNDPKVDDLGGLTPSTLNAINEQVRSSFRGAASEPGRDRPDLRVVDGSARGSDPAA